jgi:hypothetical protein
MFSLELTNFPGFSPNPILPVVVTHKRINTGQIRKAKLRYLYHGGTMMKRIMMFNLVLCLWFLTACSPGTTTEAAANEAVPTTDPLAIVPNADVDVTANETPTAVSDVTTEIATAAAATNTPAPSSTPLATFTPVVPPEPTTAPVTQPDEEALLPPDLHFTFTQEGGFAGIQQEWVIEGSGRVLQNGTEVRQLKPEEINHIYQTLLDNDFFTLAPTYKAEEQCCDFFIYTLVVQADGRTTSVRAVGGPPEIPEWLWNSFAPILVITGQLPEQ